MRTLWSRVVGLFGLGHTDRELDDEVKFHLEMLAGEYMRRGMNAADARAAAQRNFGGVTQMKEDYREQRSVPVVETFIQDARYGIRTLLRTPGFTLAALLTLALGIGANSAFFSVINAVLLQPLPFPESAELVRLERRYPGSFGSNLNGRRYLFFREHLRGVEALAAYSGMGSFNLAVGDRSEYVSALAVSKEYFDVFGVHPEHGGRFTQEHDVQGGPDVAILAHGLWQRHFGGQPDVIGRAIQLGEKSHTIIGVMPASYDPGWKPDLLLPLRPGLTGRGDGFNYTVVGRLRDDATIESATADAATVWHAFKRENPKSFVNPSGRGTGEIPSAFVSFQESLSRPVRPALLMMLAAVGVLLLIACANTANLLLARASGRGREIAVRAALGAGRARIVRQLLTESVLLSISGGALGLLLAYWSVPALLSLTPPSFTLNRPVRIDATVLIVTLAVAVLTGLVFGLAPALSLTRHDIVEAFKNDGARTATSRRSGLVRKALLVSEIALCTLLLIGAGLLIRTFIKVRGIDPGFDIRGVLNAQMLMRGERYADGAALNRFYQDGLDRIRSLPGVRSAAVTSGIPISPALNMNVDLLDAPEQITERNRLLTDWRYVTAEYFDTMRIPIVSGRGFTEADRAGAPSVAVVSEAFETQFFKGTGALGRRIRVFDADGAMEIVGVVKDLKEGVLTRRRPLPVMYVSAAQLHPAAIRTTHGYFPVNWVVRADNAGAALGQQIAEEIRKLDPRTPFSTFRTMEEIKTANIVIERFQMTLLTVFASIGLLLAAAGIYGLIAYSVAQRTREFGIRMALGASRNRILRSVLWNGTVLAFIGTAIGVVGGLWLTNLLKAFVWGVSTLDAPTFAVVAAVLMLVAVLASVIPAVRAVRLNPVSALRE
jgi:putative ABC transport system permease protein